MVLVTSYLFRFKFYDKFKAPFFLVTLSLSLYPCTLHVPELIFLVSPRSIWVKECLEIAVYLGPVPPSPSDPGRPSTAVRKSFGGVLYVDEVEESPLSCPLCPQKRAEDLL